VIAQTLKLLMKLILLILNLVNFETLDEAYSSHIELGDNKRVEIKRRGDVAIHSNKDNKKFI